MSDEEPKDLKLIAHEIAHAAKIAKKLNPDAFSEIQDLIINALSTSEILR